MPVSPETIKGCKKGDKASVKALYQESSGWMLGIAIRYIRDRNEAMSIVNLSILTAIENIKKFDEKKSEAIEAWLKTILIRKAIDYIRKIKVEENLIDSKFEPESTSAVSFNEENTGKETLLKMINALPLRTRMVFNLYAIEGYKHKEIAGMLKISDGTSKWHLSEARKKLQELLLQKDEYIKIKS